MTLQRMTEERMTEDGVPAEELPEEDYPAEDHPEADVPEEEITDEEIPGDEAYGDEAYGDEPASEPVGRAAAKKAAEPVEVVSVKFRNRGKSYYFDPAGLPVREGDRVVVETAKSLELGTIVRAKHLVAGDRLVKPLRPVIRIATREDIAVEDDNRRREREAYIIGRQKIAAHGLDMKLVDVECSFGSGKIIFFFTSDGRVDFRELVKDLAGVFRTRIELRQIGVRDEARMLGGLGICGRPYCCGTFMDDFAPVSTKMAKVQNMSLNPAKISGCCGRLMCCLRHEQAAYEELVKDVPKNGAFVETPDGYGNITQVNILRQTVKVRMDEAGENSFRTYEADEVAVVPGGRPRDGSEPPHVLVLKPKKPVEPEPPADDPWEMPERLIMTEEERIESLRRQQSARSSRPRRESQPAQRGQSRPRQQKQRSQKPNAQQGKARPTGDKPAENAAPRPKNKKPGKPKNQNQNQNQTQNQNQNHNQSQNQNHGQRQNQQQAQPQNRPVQPKPQDGGEHKSRKPYNPNYRRRGNKPRSGGQKPQNGGDAS